jgi:hypothetical protein
MERSTAGVGILIQELVKAFVDHPTRFVSPKDRDPKPSFWS